MVSISRKLLESFKFPLHNKLWKLSRSIYFSNTICFTKEDEIKDNFFNKNNKIKDKVKFPKRKFAIIHGYNGMNFNGNQKFKTI